MSFILVFETVSLQLAGNNGDQKFNHADIDEINLRTCRSEWVLHQSDRQLVESWDELVDKWPRVVRDRVIGTRPVITARISHAAEMPLVNRSQAVSCFVRSI